MKRISRAGCALLTLATMAAPQESLTLEQIVTASLRHYPSVRVSQADVRRASAGIALARTAYLPKLDIIAGVNRATRNNVLGLLLPSQVISSTTGPVLPSSGTDSDWGSTTGVLVSWEPFDFGYRAANITAAEAVQSRAEAARLSNALDVSTLAADAALTLLAAERTQIAAQAAVDRATDLERITDALVKAELRPGADSSLARAEFAAAQAQVIRAKQAVGEAKATLASLSGSDSAQITIAQTNLLSLPGSPPPDQSVENNPVLHERDAAVTEAQARLKAIDSSYAPRFSLQATTFARGTGALPDGRILAGANGLAPTVPNWGVGFTVDFSALDLPAIHARKQAELAVLDAEKARREQALIDLKARRDKALINYQSARDLAQTTPVEIEASRAAVSQSRARYQSGLGSELEVAEAQRRLAQAEIDDSLARLGVWRARLAVYAASGDITPLLTETNR